MSDMTVKLRDEEIVRWNAYWVNDEGWMDKSNAARFAEFEADEDVMSDESGVSDSDGNVLNVGDTVQMHADDRFYEIAWIARNEGELPLVGGLTRSGADWSSTARNVTLV